MWYKYTNQWQLQREGVGSLQKKTWPSSGKQSKLTMVHDH